MYSNIRIALVLCLLFSTTTWSQTEEENQDKKPPLFPKSLGIFTSLSYTQPQFYANDFLGQGYDFGGGFDIEFGFIIRNHFTIQLNFNGVSGDVVRPDLVGDIRSANLTRLSIGVGYIIELSKKFNIHPSAYYGRLALNQNINIGSGRVSDDGSFIALGLSLNYEVIRWLENFIRSKTIL